MCARPISRLFGQASEQHALTMVGPVSIAQSQGLFVLCLCSVLTLDGFTPTNCVSGTRMGTFTSFFLLNKRAKKTGWRRGLMLCAQNVACD